MADDEERPVKSGDNVKIKGHADIDGQQHGIEITGVIVSEKEKPPETGPKDVQK